MLWKKEKSLTLLENQTTVSLISSSKQRIANGKILQLLISVSLKDNRGISYVCGQKHLTNGLN